MDTCMCVYAYESVCVCMGVHNLIYIYCFSVQSFVFLNSSFYFSACRHEYTEIERHEYALYVSKDEYNSDNNAWK